MSHEVWQLFEKHVFVSEMIANIVFPLPFRVEIVNMYCFRFVVRLYTLICSSGLATHERTLFVFQGLTLLNGIRTVTHSCQTTI